MDIMGLAERIVILLVVIAALITGLNFNDINKKRIEKGKKALTVKEVGITTAVITTLLLVIAEIIRFYI